MASITVVAHPVYYTSMASMLDSINSPFLASTLSCLRLATAVMIVTLFLATLVASLVSVPAPVPVVVAVPVVVYNSRYEQSTSCSSSSSSLQQQIWAVITAELNVH